MITYFKEFYSCILLADLRECIYNCNSIGSREDPAAGTANKVSPLGTEQIDVWAHTNGGKILNVSVFLSLFYLITEYMVNQRKIKSKATGLSSRACHAYLVIKHILSFPALFLSSGPDGVNLPHPKGRGWEKSTFVLNTQMDLAGRGGGGWGAGRGMQGGVGRAESYCLNQCCLLRSQ